MRREWLFGIGVFIMTGVVAAEFPPRRSCPLAPDFPTH
jgi:hypothetical protein